MCPLQKAAALSLLLFVFLWPHVVRSLTLPEGTIRDGVARPRLLPDGDHRPGSQNLVPEIIEYNLESNLLIFKISCTDCPDYEEQRLANETVSVEVVPTTAKSCRPSDAIGLRVNGHRLTPFAISPRATQGNHGSLASPIVERSILDSVRWINLCSCTGLEDNCSDDFESILILEVVGVRGYAPGFTLTYNQHDGGRLIKISNSPDWSLMSTTLAHGSHRNAPPLDLQKGAMPTATLLSSFSSVFPSLTTSAASSQYTQVIGHVNTVTDTLPLTAASSHASSSPSLQQPDLPASSTAPEALLTVQGQQGWRRPFRTFETVAAFEHGLSALRSKAQDAAQSLVASLHSAHHCSKDEAPHLLKQNTDELDEKPWSTEGIRKQGEPAILYDLFPTPSNTARATIPTPSDTAELSDFGFSEPTPPSAHVTRTQAIKAFQITALITIILSLGGAMLALVRRNPRLRAEIAARHEERRNRRLFRKAACRYRWQQALNRFKLFRVPWGREQTNETSNDDDTITSPDLNNGINWSEWHEKRIASEESAVVTNTTGIREGLRELRKAHRLVDGMVSAEEGRYNRTTRHQRSWSDSASSEKTAPPPYEEEEVYVVDGMSYMRQVTPASSVIDTSSRSSMADSDSESEKD